MNTDPRLAALLREEFGDDIEAASEGHPWSGEPVDWQDIADRFRVAGVRMGDAIDAERLSLVLDRLGDEPPEGVSAYWDYYLRNQDGWPLSFAQVIARAYAALTPDPKETP